MAVIATPATILVSGCGGSGTSLHSGGTIRSAQGGHAGSYATLAALTQDIRLYLHQ